ncbi:hypothetical protein V8C86DRAFT_1132801 [Haematococcus lacustris]
MGARLLALLVATLAINAAARVEEPGNSLHLGDDNVSPQWSLELRHAAALPGSLESRRLVHCAHPLPALSPASAPCLSLHLALPHLRPTLPAPALPPPRHPHPPAPLLLHFNTSARPSSLASVTASAQLAVQQHHPAAPCGKGQGLNLHGSHQRDEGRAGQSLRSEAATHSAAVQLSCAAQQTWVAALRVMPHGGRGGRWGVAGGRGDTSFSLGVVRGRPQTTSP